ncbi:MAG TPA: uroporphyrinogen-III synthase [Caulobacteraceae bacterium]
MARKSLTVWITRAEPGASETAERVKAIGHKAIVAPLLQLERLPQSFIDLSDVRALAFTSANGVRAFAAASPERDFRIFCVGAATAAEAKANGFKSVLSGDGDVVALAGRIATRGRELIGGVVLHPGAAEPAGDLCGLLEKAGIKARALPLYDTVRTPLDPAFAATIPSLDAVLVHSPKAARLLAKLLAKTPAPKLRALCLSPAVARPLARAPLGERRAASFPNEAALLNLIDNKSA